MRHTDLTHAQREILLLLCDAAERPYRSPAIRLICQPNTKPNPVRETSTGCALVRKGLARRLRDGRFEATDDGFWMGDALRLDARRRASACS